MGYFQLVVTIIFPAVLAQQVLNQFSLLQVRTHIHLERAPRLPGAAIHTQPLRWSLQINELSLPPSTAVESSGWSQLHRYVETESLVVVWNDTSTSTWIGTAEYTLLLPIEKQGPSKRSLWLVLYEDDMSRTAGTPRFVTQQLAHLPRTLVPQSHQQHESEGSLADTRNHHILIEWDVVTSWPQRSGFLAQIWLFVRWFLGFSITFTFALFLYALKRHREQKRMRCREISTVTWNSSAASCDICSVQQHTSTVSASDDSDSQEDDVLQRPPCMERRLTQSLLSAGVSFEDAMERCSEIHKSVVLLNQMRQNYHNHQDVLCAQLRPPNPIDPEMEVFRSSITDTTTKSVSQSIPSYWAKPGRKVTEMQQRTEFARLTQSPPAFIASPLAVAYSIDAWQDTSKRHMPLLFQSNISCAGSQDSMVLRPRPPTLHGSIHSTLAEKFSSPICNQTMTCRRTTTESLLPTASIAGVESVTDSVIKDVIMHTSKSLQTDVLYTKDKHAKNTIPSTVLDPVAACSESNESTASEDIGRRPISHFPSSISEAQSEPWSNITYKDFEVLCTDEERIFCIAKSNDMEVDEAEANMQLDDATSYCLKPSPVRQDIGRTANQLIEESESKSSNVSTSVIRDMLKEQNSPLQPEKSNWLLLSSEAKNYVPVATTQDMSTSVNPNDTSDEECKAQKDHICMSAVQHTSEIFTEEFISQKSRSLAHYGEVPFSNEPLICGESSENEPAKFSSAIIKDETQSSSVDRSSSSCVDITGADGRHELKANLNKLLIEHVASYDQGAERFSTFPKETGLIGPEGQESHKHLFQPNPSEGRPNCIADIECDEIPNSVEHDVLSSPYVSSLEPDSTCSETDSFLDKISKPSSAELFRHIRNQVHSSMISPLNLKDINTVTTVSSDSGSNVAQPKCSIDHYRDSVLARSATIRRLRGEILPYFAPSIGLVHASEKWNEDGWEFHGDGSKDNPFSIGETHLKPDETSKPKTMTQGVDCQNEGSFGYSTLPRSQSTTTDLVLPLMTVSATAKQKRNRADSNLRRRKAKDVQPEHRSAIESKTSCMEQKAITLQNTTTIVPKQPKTNTPSIPLTANPQTQLRSDQTADTFGPKHLTSAGGIVFRDKGCRISKRTDADNADDPFTFEAASPLQQSRVVNSKKRPRGNDKDDFSFDLESPPKSSRRSPNAAKLCQSIEEGNAK